jgi:tRNA(fMet)-specific endonuclease VapC
VTQYLLDTDALIDFSKGTQPASSWILSWIDDGESVAVCGISVAEFYSGLTEAVEEGWQRFFASVQYLDITPAAAMRAGRYRYRSRLAGNNITTTDALMAAVASEYGATLVTGNVKHFPMEDLIILSIR